jgi:hypothetical protein
MGRIGGFLGGAFGGLVGGLAVAIGDKQKAAGAIAEAAARREAQYGLPLKDRLPKNEWALFVPRSDVLSLGFGSSQSVIICRLSDNAVFEFTLSERVYGLESVLQEYPGAGSGLGLPRSDVEFYGLDLPYPAPSTFLRSISQNTSAVNPSLSDAIQNQRWVSSLYSILKNEESDIRALHCKALRAISSEIPAILADKARREVRDCYRSRQARRSYLFAGLVAVVVLLPIYWQTISDWHKDPNIWPVLVGTLLFLALFILLAVGPYWEEARKARAILREMSKSIY